MNDVSITYFSKLTFEFNSYSLTLLSHSPSHVCLLTLHVGLSLGPIKKKPLSWGDKADAFLETEHASVLFFVECIHAEVAL